MANIKLKINGVHCNSCKIVLTEALQDIGAQNINVRIDTAKKLGDISCDYNDEKKVVDAINNEGYKVL